MSEDDEARDALWQARKERALEYMHLWRRERADAQRQRRTMREVPLYDYHEGEHDYETPPNDQPAP